MGKPVKAPMGEKKGKPSPSLKKGKGGKGAPMSMKKTTSQNGNQKKERGKKMGEDVYEYDDVEGNVKDELRRFAGVEVYEYEQPEHFDDDEEIDEDEAFNSDDFEVYGDVGRKKSKASRYEEDEDDEDDEDDEAGGEGDDLDGIFDESEDEAAEGGGRGDEEDEDEDEDEDVDEDAEGQHARLLSAVRSRGQEDDDGAMHVPAAAEGEFAVGSQSSHLSLQALVGSLKSGKAGQVVMKKGVSKELTKLANKGAVAVPAASVVSARALREAGYKEAAKQVSEWQPIVKQNRQKEQLQFPLNDPGRVQVTQAGLVASFQPRSKFEAEISALIKQAGADEETLRQGEELQLRKLSKSEVVERQAELSKMRSLLFHAEMKARRVNKIKSKKFHKVARKYKEKSGGIGDEELAELDEEAYKEKAEKRLRERAEERMSLKHKNTSKWVKHMLGRAYGDDAHEETRQAVVEQVKLGEELRKKMKEAESSEEEDEDEEAARLKEELEEDLEEAGKEKVKGVLGMAFMQRSMQRQREEAKKLLGDLEAMEAGEGGLSDESEMEEEGLGMRRKGKAEEGAERDETFELGSDEEAAEGEGDGGAKPSSSKRKRGRAKGGGKAVPTSGMVVDEVAFSAGSTLAVSGPTAVAGSAFEATPRNQSVERKGKTGAAVNGAEAGAGKGGAKGAKGGGKEEGKSGAKRKVKWGEVEEEAQEDEVLVGKEGVQKRGREAEEEAEGGDGGDAWETGGWLGAGGGGVEEGGGEEVENPWLVPTGKRKKGEAVVGKGGKSEKIAGKEKGGRTRQAEAVGALRRGGGGDAEEEEATLKADATIHAKEEQKAAEAKKNGRGKRGRAGEQPDNLVAPNGPGAGEAEAEEEEEEEGGRRGMLSEPSKRQKRLMMEAFAEADLQTDFIEEKQAMINASKPKEVAATPGWGGWGGDGVAEREQAKKTLEVNYRKTQQKKLQEAMSGNVKPEHRKDKNLGHVIISEKRNRRASKYMVEKQPHQFSTPEQFERSLRQPLGPDWNTSLAHNKAIQKAVVVKAGKMIDPIQQPKVVAKGGKKDLNKQASLPSAPSRA